MSQYPVSTAESKELAEVAAEAAQAVAADLRTAFRSTMDVAFKRDRHDPVTEFDRRAEARVREIIGARVPDSTIVGEEAGTSGTGRVHWYLDPIDGTANFARGIAFFCTSIGVAVDGVMVAGAVHDPMADLMFTATIDGAWCQNTRLASRGSATEATATLVTGYPGPTPLRDDRERALDHFAELTSAYGTVRRLGSAALSLAHVAAGWTDAAFAVGINAWDVSAGSLLVRSAGGVYEPVWVGESARQHDRAAFLAPGYLATTADLDAAVLRQVANDLAGAQLQTVS